jgi:hypothetical protein
METTLVIKSGNKKAIHAIKVLAQEMEMEVGESTQQKFIRPQKKLSWDDLIEAGIVHPADPSVKISDLSGIWTGQGITLSELRKKAWQRKSL